MQLQRLQLTNFRGFEHLDLAFHERLTVLVGVNGSGKSSVLDAVRLLLAGASHEALPLIYPSPPFSPQATDIREDQPEAFASLTSLVGGQKWSHEEKWLVPANGVHVSMRRQIKTDVDRLRLLDASQWLSLIYTVRRALLEEQGHPKTQANSNHLSFQAAYQGNLTSQGTFAPFLRWFRAREDIENEQRLRDDPSLRDPQLQAVRRAITSMMPGYDNLFVQRHPREMMVLSKNGKKLGLQQLSDGEKCLLAMAGDLARRMAMLTFDNKDPLEVEALVMIDEIELHLHPRWQREVVPALLRTFPKTQFVLTTHSPQVLSSVAQESIFVLDDFKLYPAGSPARGRDSTSILVDLMGLPQHPSETAERLHRIALLLDDDDRRAEARVAIEELASELGENDQEVVRLRTLLGFLEG